MFTEYMMKNAEKQWTTKAGYEAIVVVQPQGHRCGYVKVPKGHPVDYRQYDEIDIDVHGGSTYRDYDNDGTIFGFDCAHYGDAPDVSLMDLKYRLVHDQLCSVENIYVDGVIRSLDYCIEECENMAKQFKELETNQHTDI